MFGDCLGGNFRLGSGSVYLVLVARIGQVLFYKKIAQILSGSWYHASFWYRGSWGIGKWTWNNSSACTSRRRITASLILRQARNIAREKLRQENAPNKSVYLLHDFVSWSDHATDLPSYRLWRIFRISSGKSLTTALNAHIDGETMGCPAKIDWRYWKNHRRGILKELQHFPFGHYFEK